MLWHDNCLIPLHAAHPVDAMEWINFYYQPPVEAMIEDWVNYLCPVPAAKKVINEPPRRPDGGGQPAGVPAEVDAAPLPQVLRLQGRRRTTTSTPRSSTRSSSREPLRMTARAARLRRWSVPYLLGLPAGAWLALFFVVPLVAILSVSLMTGNSVDGFTLTWNFSVYPDVIDQYSTQFGRSFLYGALSTVIALVVMYPVAYWIAFRGGRYKSTLLSWCCCPSSSPS